MGTVTLPNTSFVGGTFDGAYYMAPKGVNGIIRIYTPPVGGNGAATLVATKDASPNNIGAITWDPNRGMLWRAFADNVYLIDLGNKTVSGPVVSSTFMFNPGVGGSGLMTELPTTAATTHCTTALTWTSMFTNFHWGPTLTAPTRLLGP